MMLSTVTFLPGTTPMATIFLMRAESSDLMWEILPVWSLDMALSVTISLGASVAALHGSLQEVQSESTLLPII